MLTRQLTPAKRAQCALLAVGALVGAVSFAMQVFATIKGDHATWGRAVMATLAVWSLGYAVLLGSIAIRGKMNLRKDRSTIAGLRSFFFVFISMVLLLVSGLQLKYEPASNLALFTATVGLASLVWATWTAIWNLVQQSELNVREKLLEIELKLAEMGERLPGRQQ